MPQKRNPDVLELLRARAGTVDGYATQCRGIVRGLPSGYNRDLQDTKEPLMRALSTVEDSLIVAKTLVDRLVPQRDRMREALNAEVFATDYAYKLVEEGLPFREAYRIAAKDYRDQPLPDADEALARRRSTGTPGKLNLAEPRERLTHLRETIAARRERHSNAVAELSGESASVRPVRE